MEKNQMGNKQRNPKKRTKHKANLAKAAIYAFLGIGSFSLLVSIVYVSSILALIGLALVFWGALLLYISPEEYTKKALLDATVIPPLESLNQIIRELGYKGKAIYLPPKYLKDPEANKIYIPRQKAGKLPKPEIILEHENELFFHKPYGILLTPPGAQLLRLFEKQLETNFAKTDLMYVTQHLPKLLIQDLEIAENIEIETENNKIKTKITGSTFKEIHNENNDPSHIPPSIGCPLSSAIACALAKAIGKPITIEDIQPSKDGKNIEITYQFLGKIETKLFLQEKKPEELPTQPLQLEIRKGFGHNLASLLLTAIGSIFLAEVAWVTFYDMTIWGKDIAQIFLESRTGEAISFGIGMKIIHHFLIGLASFLSGIITYFRRRIRV